MKAILVIEMPKTCKDCKLTYLDTGDDTYYGSNTQRCIFDDAEEDANGRYFDCPLRPLPKKKETMNAIQYSGLAEEYRKEGWNECLKEILGEE